MKEKPRMENCPWQFLWDHRETEPTGAGVEDVLPSVATPLNTVYKLGVLYISLKRIS